MAPISELVSLNYTTIGGSRYPEIISKHACNQSRSPWFHHKMAFYWRFLITIQTVKSYNTYAAATLMLVAAPHNDLSLQ